MNQILKISIASSSVRGSRWDFLKRITDVGGFAVTHEGMPENGWRAATSSGTLPERSEKL